MDEGCNEEIKVGCLSFPAGSVTRKGVFAEKIRETTKVAEYTGATAVEDAAAEATIGAAAAVAVAVTGAARATSLGRTVPTANRAAAEASDAVATTCIG